MEEREFRREAEDLVRLWGELGRRLGQSGFRGIGDMLELHEQLRKGTERISQVEIEAALTHVASLTDRLRVARQQMGRLRELKEKLPPV